MEQAKNDPKQIVLFLDPMHQVHNNENDYCWQFKGKQNTKVIGTNSGRRRLNIIGAINPLNLIPIIILTECNCNKELMIAYLQHIKEELPVDAKISIILDNASYNKAYETQAKATELGIEFIFLPSYSPNLNLIERLWKYFKKQVIKNKYYQEYSLFEKEVEKFFQNFDEHIENLETILTPNFGIIKTS